MMIRMPRAAVLGARKEGAISCGAAWPKWWGAALGCLLATTLGVWAQGPSSVWVDDDWTGPENCGGHTWDLDAFKTIQAGVNAVAPSGTVNVAAGIYPEQIVIGKTLELLGPNRELAGNNPGRLPEAVITYPAGITTAGEVLVNVLTDVHGVTIAGLDLRYQEYLVDKWPYLIFTSKVGDLTIRNNRMLGGEVAVYVLTDDNQTVYRDGLLIEGNYIDGGPFVNCWYNRGMYVQATAGTVQDNVITNVNTGIQIMPYAHPAGGVVQRNLVAAGLIGLYHNYQNKGAGAWVWASNEVTVADNDRQGLKAELYAPWTTQSVTFRGIELITFGAEGSGAAPQVTFNNNAIDGTLADSPLTTGREAVRMTTAGTGARATLFENSFANCSVGATNATTVLMDAPRNWWGSKKGPTHATNPGGNGAPVSDNVVFSPWLGYEADQDSLAIGYQPDPRTVAISPTYEMWRNAFFTPEQLAAVEISGDDSDPDHDGMSNLSEYLANTIPTNGLSCLVMGDMSLNPGVAGELIVRWQSASNRWYTLQATTNPLDGFNITLQSNILSTPPENVYTDRLDSAVQSFYRVLVE